MKKLIILFMLLSLCGCSISVPTVLPNDNSYTIDQLLESFENGGHQKEEADYAVVINQKNCLYGIIMDMDPQELNVYFIKDHQIVQKLTHPGHKNVDYIPDSLKLILTNPYEENQDLFEFTISYFYSADDTIIHVTHNENKNETNIEEIGIKDKIDEQYLTQLFNSVHPNATLKQLLVMNPYLNYYGAALYTDEFGNDCFDLLQKYDSSQHLGDLYFLEDTKLVQNGNQLFFKVKHYDGRITTQFITFEKGSMNYSEKSE